METTDLAEYLSNCIISYDRESLDLEYNTYFGRVLVPIDKIDDIPCEVVILFHDKICKLVIRSNEPYYDEDLEAHMPYELYCTDYYFISKLGTDSNNIKIYLDKWFLDIEELVYNKITCRFVKKNKYHIFKFINNMKNVSFGEDCCVCHEKTTKKTNCNHHLCYTCLIQIKRNDEGDILCPMCRDSL